MMVRKEKHTFALLRPLRAWSEFMPFAWLVPAFGMPVAGLQVQSLTKDPQAPVSWPAFGFAGMAVLALAGLSLILLRIDQEYYGDDVSRV